MANSKATGVAYSDPAIVGGTIDNTPIGATTAAAGSFTTVTASGAITGGSLVLDAAMTATVAEINRAADVSGRVVTLTATTVITEALHEGKTLLMKEAGGNALCTFTLPAATGGGARYRFVVGEVNTSNYVIASVVGTDLMEGIIIGASTTDSATDAARTWLSGASDDTVLLNGTTTGGAALGDWVEFEDLTSTGWYVRGMVTQSGAEATPFANAVA
jgi:hypothetical protein